MLYKQDLAKRSLGKSKLFKMTCLVVADVSFVRAVDVVAIIADVDVDGFSLREGLLQFCEGRLRRPSCTLRQLGAW